MGICKRTWGISHIKGLGCLPLLEAWGLQTGYFFPLSLTTPHPLRSCLHEQSRAERSGVGTVAPWEMLGRRNGKGQALTG